MTMTPELIAAMAPILECVASIDGAYGIDDNEHVNTRDFIPQCNDYSPITWGELRQLVAAFKAARA